MIHGAFFFMFTISTVGIRYSKRSESGVICYGANTEKISPQKPKQTAMCS